MKLVIVSHDKFMSQVMNAGCIMVAMGSVYALVGLYI